MRTPSSPFLSTVLGAALVGAALLAPSPADGLVAGDLNVVHGLCSGGGFIVSQLVTSTDGSSSEHIVVTGVRDGSDWTGSLSSTDAGGELHQQITAHADGGTFTVDGSFDGAQVDPTITLQLDSPHQSCAFIAQLYGSITVFSPCRDHKSIVLREKDTAGGKRHASATLIDARPGSRWHMRVEERTPHSGIGVARIGKAGPKGRVAVSGLFADTSQRTVSTKFDGANAPCSLSVRTKPSPV